MSPFWTRIINVPPSLVDSELQILPQLQDLVMQNVLIAWHKSCADGWIRVYIVMPRFTRRTGCKAAPVVKSLPVDTFHIVTMISYNQPPLRFLTESLNRCSFGFFHERWTQPVTFLNLSLCEIFQTFVWCSPHLVCEPLEKVVQQLEHNLRCALRLLTPVFCFLPLLSCFRRPRRASLRGSAVTNCSSGSGPAGILPHKDCLFCFTWAIFVCLSLFCFFLYFLLCFNKLLFFLLSLLVVFVCLS